MTTPPLIGGENMMVKDLFCWDAAMVTYCVNGQDTSLILQIHLSLINVSNSWIWMLDKCSLYLVKGGYKVSINVVYLLPMLNVLPSNL